MAFLLFYYIYSLNYHIMSGILRILLTAVAVYLLPKILSGVVLDKFSTAIWVALVLALLQFLVKPLLIFLTLPITILTMGLFLFIVNAIIILMAAYLVSGFEVANIWWALLFSVLLSILQSALYQIVGVGAIES